MHNRGQLIFGGALVLLGLMSLFSALFHIDFGAICWPVGLIMVGVWLVLRPRMVGPDHGSEVILLGELRRRGNWTVKSEEFWLGVGDADVDLTSAVIPPGQTDLHFYTFVSEVRVYVPKSVGVSVHINGFVVDSDLLGRNYDGILTPVEVSSENYAESDCRVRIEMSGFVANMRVRQI